jgi:hypothetical protein
MDRDGSRGLILFLFNCLSGMLIAPGKWASLYSLAGITSISCDPFATRRCTSSRLISFGISVLSGSVFLDLFNDLLPTLLSYTGTGQPDHQLRANFSGVRALPLYCLSQPRLTPWSLFLFRVRDAVMSLEFTLRTEHLSAGLTSVLRMHIAIMLIQCRFTTECCTTFLTLILVSHKIFSFRPVRLILKI